MMDGGNLKFNMKKNAKQSQCRQISFIFLFETVFSYSKKFRHFSLYGCMRSEKFERKQFFVLN